MAYNAWLPVANHCSIIWICPNLSTDLSMGIWVLAIYSSSQESCCGHLCTSFYGHTPSFVPWNASEWNGSVLWFLRLYRLSVQLVRNCQSDVQKYCIIAHLHQQSKKLPVALYPWWYLMWSFQFYPLYWWVCSGISLYFYSLFSYILPTGSVSCTNLAFTYLL